MRVLLAALATFEHELRLDVEAELIDRDEARRMDAEERTQTARLLAELRELRRKPEEEVPRWHSDVRMYSLLH